MTKLVIFERIFPVTPVIVSGLAKTELKRVERVTKERGYRELTFAPNDNAPLKILMPPLALERLRRLTRISLRVKIPTKSAAVAAVV